MRRPNNRYPYALAFLNRPEHDPSEADRAQENHSAQDNHGHNRRQFRRSHSTIVLLR